MSINLNKQQPYGKTFDGKNVCEMVEFCKYI